MHRIIFAAVGALCLGIASVSSTFAVGDLHGALLTARDAPPGYKTPHFRIYTRFTRKMVVTTSVKGLGKATSSCEQPASYAHDGWTGGIIEAFDGPNILSGFNVCGAIFKSATGAHTAFATEVASLRVAMRTQKSVKVLQMTTIGSESLEIGSTTQGFEVGAIVFRHTNAVIEMLYVGLATYQLSSLARLARRVDGHLK